MRVLIIGLGSIAKKHIRALEENFKGTEIIALRSGRNKEELPGVKNIYQLDELKETPDFILISNPTSEHASSIKQCMAYKKPLFIEKPLFHKLDGVPELIEEAEKKHIQSYTACNLRFLDCLNFVKEHITSEKPVVNEVNAYCGSSLPDWRPGTDYKSSYSANAEMGGGVHLDLIHELDYMCWIFGEPLHSFKTLTSRSNIAINSVDYANYILDYRNFTASITLNYFRKDAKRTLEIVFNEDTWLVDILKNTVTSLVDNRVIFSSEQKIIDTYSAQMNYFVDSISVNKPLMNTMAESYEVLKICLD